MKPILLFLALVVVAMTSFTSAHKVLMISDLHLDIFYGTPRGLGRNGGHDKCQNPDASPYGTYGCDSPLSLIKSMVKDVLTNFPDVKLTVFTGDWLRHDMHQQAQGAEESVAAVAHQIGQLPGHIMSSPQQKMAASLGNNDFVPDYYFNYTAPPTQLMKAFAREMANHSLLFENETAFFEYCGYYTRTVTPELEVIVLNTLIWSENVVPVFPASDSDPCEQFEFLNSTLTKAQELGRKAYIISHIPPQVNFFNAWSSSSFAGSGHFWQTAFLQRYERIVASFPETVAAHLYGHTHKFAFMGEETWSAPLFILPAISPIFGNTPSYLVATTDDSTGLILDFEQRTINMTTGEWITASPSLARSVFETDGTQFSPLTVPVLNSVAKQLASNDTTWNNFLKAYSGGPPYKNQFGERGCSANCRLLYSCYSQYGDYHLVNVCTGVVFKRMLQTEEGARVMRALGVSMEDQWRYLKEEGQQ